MNQPEDSKQRNIKESEHSKHIEIRTEISNSENIRDANEISAEALAVTEEIAELLGKEDIITAVQKYKADSEDKKIAVEFVNSHIQFLNQIVENDHKKGIERTDVVIREMISHVNSMLKKREEYLFTTMVMHSPLHYRSIQKRINTKIKKEDKNNKK